MKFINIFIFVILFSIMALTPIYAQSAPPATPIDGGLSVLLGAGGLYALKKLRESYKSSD